MLILKDACGAFSLAGVEGFEPPNGGIKTRVRVNVISKLLILRIGRSPPLPSIPRRSHQGRTPSPVYKRGRMIHDPLFPGLDL
jgi:hypothetical protein